VNDATQLQPFENTFSVLLQKPAESTGGKGERERPPKENEGDERERPGGLELPECIRITEDQWSNQNPPFDKHTALIIKDSGKGADAGSGEPDKVVYDFFINADNIHLQRFLKYELRSGEDDKVARSRFELGLMLTGLALIYQDNLERKEQAAQKEDEDTASKQSIEQRVAEVTKAFAPFLLPMIDALGALDEEKVAAGSASGEAT
jgi:hypothetical protein